MTHLMPLAILEAIKLIWYDQGKCSSTITPRNLVSLTLVTTLLYRCSFVTPLQREDVI